MSTDFSYEAQKLLAFGSANPSAVNLHSQLLVLNYIRIAADIISQLPADRCLRLLDWGAGVGHMSYVLAQRGYDVISFDVLEDGARLSDQPLVQQTVYHFEDLELPRVTTTDPVHLPFPEAHFDAVLSCGVLEHVVDEHGSLREIRRVLKPGGHFFVYQLPQKGSWLEFVIGLFKLGYVHERKYSAGSIRRLLAEEGFRIRSLRRANMLPKLFTGLPPRLKRLPDARPVLVLQADQALARVPLLNQVSGVLEVAACKI